MKLDHAALGSRAEQERHVNGNRRAVTEGNEHAEAALCEECLARAGGGFESRMNVHGDLRKDCTGGSGRHGLTAPAASLDVSTKGMP
jgi:hypothetical protein